MGWTRTRPFGPRWARSSAARHPRCGRDSGKNQRTRRSYYTSDYEVGLQPATDDCGLVLPMRNVYQVGGEKVHPALRVLRPGDAVGNLLDYSTAADATVLTAKGQLFQRRRSTLAELYDGAAIFDAEFQFLPGVLENIVEARSTRRPATSEAREKELLEVFGRPAGCRRPADHQNTGPDRRREGRHLDVGPRMKYREHSRLIWRRPTSVRTDEPDPPADRASEAGHQSIARFHFFIGSGEVDEYRSCGPGRRR